MRISGRRNILIVSAGVMALAGGAIPLAQADRAKLTTAYADVDRLFTEFTTQQHVPGAAWGIVVDGEIAHVGVAGLRERNGAAGEGQHAGGRDEDVAPSCHPHFLMAGLV